MNTASWRATVNSPTFALAELCIAAVSGAALYLVPSVGIWAIAASLIPWAFRVSVGEPPFRRSGLDWLIALFVLSAGAGFWASYDQTVAFDKFLFILLSVILFYALRAQPQENLVWVSFGLFCVGVGISVYFFLTHDFLAAPRKIEVVNVIGRWIMRVRPELGWRAIHPNYVAGIAAIMSPFGFYLLLQRENNIFRSSRMSPLIVLGLILVFFAMFMTTSRGILMAVISAAGIVLLRAGIKVIEVIARRRNDAVFPSIVMLYLLAVVLLLYIGPARSESSASETGVYGNGSRAELFARSLYLAADFPITGGGLASFPGLYSQYILDIPIYYLPNSHNMFLDVFIEQGVFGGTAFLLLYLAGIWRTSRSIAGGESRGDNLLHWTVLTSLLIAFVHGMVDDYLYYGNGAILSVALLGIVPAQFKMQSVFGNPNRFQRADILVLASIGAGLVALLLIYQNTLRSTWYANLGAVQMARVELSGFPTNQWAGPDILEGMQDAEASLLASVEADPSNRTANHRLGLIAMLRRDFASATAFLETAYAQSPGHRGIVKSLGFSHAWNGDLGLAQPFLAAIPESRNELDTYVWYWAAQGLPELSSYALAMKDKIHSMTVQP